jgi:soluble lytic murein transglycosylase
MLVTPPKLHSFLTVIAIALLILAAAGLRLPGENAPAQLEAALFAGPMDGTATGSLAPAIQASFTVPASITPPETGVSGSPPDFAVPANSKPAIEFPSGSAAFQEALSIITSGGSPVEAYEKARSLSDDAERRTVQWAAIYFGDGKVDYESVIRFSADAPAFSDTSVFKTRLEQALMRADAAGPEVIRVLGGAMPNTISAQIALALAYVEDGQKERAARIARQIWTTEFLTKAEEDRVQKRLGGLLGAEDHWARAVHLMMHDRARGAERLLPFLTEAQKSLVIARNAVSRNAKNAKKLLDDVDPSMQDHPVFVFSRAQRARQFKLWEDAVSWLDKARGNVPDAAEFWYERRALVRELLARKDYALAYRAAAGYTEGPDGRLVEAHFHAGWIALVFLNDPAAATDHFEKMRQNSTLAESVTQSNYWLGRARLALGDRSGADSAFATAAKHRTVFYGLLARAELELEEPLLKDLPDESGSYMAFMSNDVVKAVRLLAGNGKPGWGVPLLRSFAHGLEDAGQLRLAAQLADEIDEPSLAIRIAEDADQRGVPLDPIAFPKDRLPVTHVAEIDPAAIYAVTRQESHFQIDAVSSAGARGFMQLMPGTAKETAQKLGVAYSKSRLTTDGAYNALLGSTYLAAQLRRFDGSLLLAAAAYNAGGGNANKWIRAFGDPRDPKVDPVVWVEQIPVQETRNYVKRVFGNYLVYRARLGNEEPDVRRALRAIEW